MREFKFRIWDKISRKMYDVKAINWLAKDVTVFTNKTNSIAIPFEEVEIMQYTGFKDDNGIEIYEGDVCVCGGEWCNPSTYIIKYPDGKKGYFAESPDGFEVPVENFDNLTVIGNIYELPEIRRV